MMPTDLIKPQMPIKTYKSFMAICIFALIHFPQVLAACPACVGTTRNTTLFYVGLGCMILLPYPLVYFVYRYFKNGEAKEINKLKHLSPEQPK